MCLMWSLMEMAAMIGDCEAVEDIPVPGDETTIFSGECCYYDDFVECNGSSLGGEAISIEATWEEIYVY